MSTSRTAPRRLPAIVQWTGPGRALVFVLAASSIWCLLSEMLGLCDMRTFFYGILAPATVGLYGLACLDTVRGDGRLGRAVVLGSLAGLAGAAAYDVFRLPFVFADAWGLSAWRVPQMPLFKVFPRFGALILGEPMEQGAAAGQPGYAWGAGYGAAAHALGWAYHFSNGATFGVMFAAMFAGGRRDGRSLVAAPGVDASARAMNAAARGRGAFVQTVFWATVMAIVIELILLVSPYAPFFGIHITTRFVVVTMAAHIVFGIGLGVYYAWHDARWRLAPATVRAF